MEKYLHKYFMVNTYSIDNQRVTLLTFMVIFHNIYSIMIHLKTFESFLFESKSVGPLYHFTDFNGLTGILEEDRMESSAMFDYISFTRNPLFKFHNKNIRLSFNGDAMSNRFHFEPFLYDPEKDPMYYDPEPMDYTERRELYGEEREERITRKEIKGIKKYISLIEIPQDVINKLHYKKDMPILDKLEKENPEIEFRIVKSFSLPSTDRHAQSIGKKMAA